MIHNPKVGDKVWHMYADYLGLILVQPYEIIGLGFKIISGRNMYVAELRDLLHSHKPDTSICVYGLYNTQIEGVMDAWVTNHKETQEKLMAKEQLERTMKYTMKQ